MTRTVLIVEDNELNLKLFTDILSLNGFSVLTSSDGFDVLDILKSNQVNIVLMDIQLKDISGLEIVKAIKAEPDICNIPIIAVTAFAMYEDEAVIISSGCDGYISKPVTMEKFLRKINDVLNQYEQKKILEENER